MRADPLGALWRWLSSWIGPDGGVHGPVVHRSDLKRLFAIHDTPWTQHAVIEGLLHLYRRSGRDYWLAHAARLADAQCLRLRPDGSFRWAGHEDDRFSSLVHNCLADRALLEASEALRASGDSRRADRYVAAAERNVREYVVGSLYRPALGGFAVDPVDHYAGRDRFVVNMNAVAAAVLAQLDRERADDAHGELVAGVLHRIREHQADGGDADGGFAYSDLEPTNYVTIYSALTLRAVAALGEMAGRDAAQRAVRFLARMEDADSRLWRHRLDGGRLYRFPLFVAGAGMICSALVDASRLTGEAPDSAELAGRLLRFRYGHGPIRNFLGYDHPDNGRRRGRGADSWEDVFPTPSWNAQAFAFLARVLPPPDPPEHGRVGRAGVASRRAAYVETDRLAAVAGIAPVRHAVAAVYLKRARYGLVVPGPEAIRRALARRLAAVRG